MTLNATYSGLRVLELATNIAGPFAAMILGDLGADVIKIERLPNGDDTRGLPPQWKGHATIFAAVNRNKRGLALNFKSPEGREALLKLAETADVVIESFPPGVAVNLRLTDEDFRKRNPRLITCTVSAFGAGPKGAQMPGYDALVQAMSGMMSFTGDEGGSTVRVAPSLLDLSTGMWGAMAIMAALARRKDGVGEHINVALLDSAFTLMCHQVLGYLATGEQPVKLGSGTPSAAPYRVYSAADGEMMVATTTNAQFERLCGALNLQPLAREERFLTPARRLASRAELDALLAERIASAPVAEWLERLGGAGISCGPVNDLRSALNADYALERKLFVEPATAADYGLPLLRLPIDSNGACVKMRPPTFGEHSAEILQEIGYDAEGIARLSGGQDSGATGS